MIRFDAQVMGKGRPCCGGMGLAGMYVAPKMGFKSDVKKMFMGQPPWLMKNMEMRNIVARFCGPAPTPPSLPSPCLTMFSAPMATQVH